MMKMLAIMALVVTAYMASSFFFEPEYHKHETWHKVTAGETVWDIATQYYDYQEKYRNFNEWRWVISEANNLKGKHIQAGDLLVIPLYNK